MGVYCNGELNYATVMSDLHSRSTSRHRVAGAVKGERSGATGLRNVCGEPRGSSRQPMAETANTST